MDTAPVAKWGTRTFVSEAMLNDVGEDQVKAHLIRVCVAKAEDDGFTHLPGRDNVRFVRREDDPIAASLYDTEGEHAEWPEGTVIAFTTIRCVLPS